MPASRHVHDSSPRPLPPEKPLASDCCESGCAVCVFDHYAEQREAYRKALKDWLVRHPEAENGNESA